MPLSRVWWRVTAVAALATQVMAQQCYYPNGDKAPDTERPCSSAKGSACCPQNWECLDNGLCHYPANNIYGRYSCTDKDWKSDGCPSNLCTYGLKAAGGESITQCSNHNKQWCCNADNVHVNCCQESPSPRPFFALQDPVAYATIGSMTASTAPNLAIITGQATGSGSGDQPSTSPTPASQSSDAPSSPNSPQSSNPPLPSDSLSSPASRDPIATESSGSGTKPFTSVFFSASSGSTGVVSVPITSVITPTSDVTTQSNNGGEGGKSDSNLGLIIGCAVGIPLGLTFIGFILWFLRRRHRKPNPYHQNLTAEDDSTNLAGGAASKLSKEQAFRKSGPPAAEIDGNPVGPGRPVSTVLGHAELESGNGFRPGHSMPYTPDAVGLGGGNVHPDRDTWDSVPPQYSPGQHYEPYNHPQMSELADTSTLPTPNEKRGEQHAGH